MLVVYNYHFNSFIVRAFYSVMGVGYQYTPKLTKSKNPLPWCPKRCVFTNH